MFHIQAFFWTVHKNLENDLETRNKPTDVIHLTTWTLATHTLLDFIGFYYWKQ